MTDRTKITGWLFCEMDKDGYPSKMKVLKRDECTWQEPLRINPLDCLSETDRTTGVTLMSDKKVTKGLIMSRISGATDEINLRFKTMRINKSLEKALTGEERLQVYYNKLEENSELEGDHPIFRPPGPVGDGGYRKEPADVVDTRKNKYKKTRESESPGEERAQSSSSRAVSRNRKRKDSSGDGGGGKRPRRDEEKKVPGKLQDRSDSENQQ